MILWPVPEPHPYYTGDEYAEQRQRDEANRVFAGVLAEALRRMAAEHDGQADDAGLTASYGETVARRHYMTPDVRRIWLDYARTYRTNEREQRELAELYRRYAEMMAL